MSYLATSTASLPNASLSWNQNRRSEQRVTPTATIDLHGYTKEQAIRTLTQFLEDCVTPRSSNTATSKTTTTTSSSSNSYPSSNNNKNSNNNNEWKKYNKNKKKQPQSQSQSQQKQQQRPQQQHQWVCVITGVGAHSGALGGPVLKQAVHKLLEKRQMEYCHAKKKGYFIVNALSGHVLKQNPTPQDLMQLATSTSTTTNAATTAATLLGGGSSFVLQESRTHDTKVKVMPREFHHIVVGGQVGTGGTTNNNIGLSTTNTTTIIKKTKPLGKKTRKALAYARVASAPPNTSSSSNRVGVGVVDLENDDCPLPSEIAAEQNLLDTVKSQSLKDSRKYQSQRDKHEQELQRILETTQQQAMEEQRQQEEELQKAMKLSQQESNKMTSYETYDEEELERVLKLSLLAAKEQNDNNTSSNNNDEEEEDEEELLQKILSQSKLEHAQQQQADQEELERVLRMSMMEEEESSSSSSSSTNSCCAEHNNIGGGNSDNDPKDEEHDDEEVEDELQRVLRLSLLETSSTVLLEEHQLLPLEQEGEEEEEDDDDDSDSEQLQLEQQEDESKSEAQRHEPPAMAYKQTIDDLSTTSLASSSEASDDERLYQISHHTEQQVPTGETLLLESVLYQNQSTLTDSVTTAERKPAQQRVEASQPVDYPSSMTQQQQQQEMLYVPDVDISQAPTVGISLVDFTSSAKAPACVSRTSTGTTNATTTDSPQEGSDEDDDDDDCHPVKLVPEPTVGINLAAFTSPKAPIVNPTT